MTVETNKYFKPKFFINAFNNLYITVIKLRRYAATLQNGEYKRIKFMTTRNTRKRYSRDVTLSLQTKTYRAS